MVPGPKFGTGTKLEAVHTVNGEGWDQHRNDQLLQRGGVKKAEISLNKHLDIAFVNEI